MSFTHLNKRIKKKKSLIKAKVFTISHTVSFVCSPPKLLLRSGTRNKVKYTVQLTYPKQRHLS